jgi:hypothetical protein
MGPESHIMVKFLRYLGFNQAANEYAESLRSGREVSLHATLYTAVDELIELSQQIPESARGSSNFFAIEQAKLFEIVVNKYNLRQLSSPYPEMRIEVLDSPAPDELGDVRRVYEPTTP